MLKRTPLKAKAKRPVEKPVELPDFLQDYSGPVGDEGISFSDRAFWIDDLRIADWLDAFEAVDEHGDKKALTAMLRSDRELSPAARYYLADLIERKMIPVPPNRPKIPAYDRSDAEARLLLAKIAARGYVKEGYGVKGAVEKAAAEYEIPEPTLADAYGGKRGTTARIAKRHRPYPP